MIEKMRKKLAKFIQTVDDVVYKALARTAKERGITVQQLIRAIIIPEWVKRRDIRNPAKTSK